MIAIDGAKNGGQPRKKRKRRKAQHQKKTVGDVDPRKSLPASFIFASFANFAVVHLTHQAC